MFRPDAVFISSSRYALFFCVLLFSLCFLSISLTSLAGFSFVFFVITTVFLVYLLRQYVFLINASAIVELVWKDAGWWLTQKNGQVIETEISLSSVVTQNCLLLCFSSLENTSKTYRVLLFPDSVDEESLRRLRVCVLQAL